MNGIKDKKQMDEETNFPTDKEILNTLYKHYGKPKKIVKEKVKIYRGYMTPAGWKVDDWMLGGWQLGRVNIYVEDKNSSKYLFGGSATIEDEGIGSWFIGIKKDKMKIWIGSKVDKIVKIIYS